MVIRISPSGGVPARTPDEFAVYVDKVIAYETRVLSGKKRGRHVLFADADYPDSTGHAAGLAAVDKASPAHAYFGLGFLWSAWSAAHNKQLLDQPFVLSPSPATLEVYVRTQANTIEYRAYDGSNWGKWQSLGAPPVGALSSPSVAAWNVGRRDLFVRGGDGQLWSRWSNGGQWSEWVAKQISIDGAPDVVAPREYALDVYFRTVNGGIAHLQYDGEHWSDLESLGAPDANGSEQLSDPTVAAWSAGRRDVFVRGRDGCLWTRIWGDMTGWSGWMPHGDAILGRPRIISPAIARLDLFVISLQKQVRRKYFDGTAWSDWEDLPFLSGGVDATTGIGVAAYEADRRDVFVRAAGGKLQTAWWWHLPAGWQAADAKTVGHVARDAWWITYVGHGSPGGWSGGGVDGQAVAAFDTADNFPIVFSTGCNTGQFLPRARHSKNTLE